MSTFSKDDYILNLLMNKVTIELVFIRKNKWKYKTNFKVLQCELCPTGDTGSPVMLS